MPRSRELLHEIAMNFEAIADRIGRTIESGPEALAESDLAGLHRAKDAALQGLSLARNGSEHRTF